MDMNVLCLFEVSNSTLIIITDVLSEYYAFCLLRVLISILIVTISFNRPLLFWSLKFTTAFNWHGNQYFCFIVSQGGL